MTNSKTFITFYCSLLFGTIALVIVALNIPIVSSTIQNFWQIWIVSVCLSYLVVGLGFSVPVAIIGLALSWLQLVLLFNNKIDPHLEDQGFAAVLKAIFSQFYHLLQSKIR